MDVEKLPQWDIEIKEIPLTGDKVTVCDIDFIFGNWEPDENYTTSYNVQIGRTVGECARNLGAAINCIDGRFGGWHLNRYINSVYALQFGKIVHLRMRDLKSSGSNVIVESDAGDRIVITEYEGNVPEGGGGGGGESVLIKKTIATNGTYNATGDSADGYSEVTVNVPGFIKPIHTNVSDGYVNRPASGNETSWKIQLNSSNRSDIFQVKANTRYIFSLSNKVGNRFAILFSETDPYVSIQDVPGVYVNMLFNQGYNIAGAPQAYSHGYYTTPSDGFITITKTNKGDDVNLYVVEIPTEATDQ